MADAKRETTQEIARRVLKKRREHSIRSKAFNYVRDLIRDVQEGRMVDHFERADLAELLRRAAAGECEGG